MGETRILTAAQMRWADKQTIQSGVSEFDLMDCAGHLLADVILDCMPDYGRVVFVAGSGNNAGDGYAAAHYLRLRRIPVTIVSLTALDTLSGAAKKHAEKAQAGGVKIRLADSVENIHELNRWLLRAVLIVDVLLGVGLNRPLHAYLQKVVAKINASDRPVLSVDIASGICADTGVMMGAAVKADYTLPIAASKWGHWLAEGRDYTGKLLNVADIGITESTIEQSWGIPVTSEHGAFSVHSSCLINGLFLNRAWPERSRMTHKGNYGHVCVFGGSVGHTGAPQLAGLGAYAAGAGLASIICPDDIWSVLAAANMEVMCYPESQSAWQQADAIVAGPGWGKLQQYNLALLLDSDKPLLLDADALNMVADDTQLQQQVADRFEKTGAVTIMTPHPGEAARLLGQGNDEIQARRKESILALTTRYKCWVVLKGSETLISSPQGDIYLNPFGSAQLAIAGSGDILAGMIGAQLARFAGENADLGLLISAAVALHGKAGESCGWYLAGDLARKVADLRQHIERGGRA